MMKESQKKGITLVALIITVIVLLILAGITINLSLGEDGIIKRAEEAGKNYTNAADFEETQLAEFSNLTDMIIDNVTKNHHTIVELKKSNKAVAKDTIIKDESGNLIMIKKGFKLASDSGLTVQQGIVVEDENRNQYVWIPVSKDSSKVIHKDDNTTFVNLLARRNFEENNYIVDELGNVALNGHFGAYYTETSDNTSAKNLTEFINKVKENGGFYVGRYEAGKDEDGNFIVQSSPVQVYNNVSLDTAKELVQNFSSNNVLSDLVNSFAWDTMLNYMEECGNNFNPSEVKSYGGATNVNYQEDACKLYDVVSNHCEFGTEYCSYSTFNYGTLGGNYTGQYGSNSAKSRSTTLYGWSGEEASFRVLLYW